MKILIGCEESGVIRDAFIARGHDAISCDLQPTRRPGPHYYGDIMDLKDEHYDLAIFHPTCTYLTNSGVRWLHEDASRWPKLFDGCEFFNALKYFNCDKIAIENPIPHKYATALVGKYSQLVQPYHFGDMKSKATCFWLYGLPKLTKTNDVKEQMLKTPCSEWQSGFYASPGPDRARIRSESHAGMAKAIAEQWG